MFIPFTLNRKAEMAAYAKRHYGMNTYELKHPRTIVEHVAQADSIQSIYNTFASDRADVELGERPNVCAHFGIDGDGTIYQLVPTSIMCRHVVGLNYTSIGIEHVGSKDEDVLHNQKVLRASLELTNWLRCTFRIPVKHVIGHNESLSSPYHHERIKSLRTQTHGDFTEASMRIYRGKLKRLACGNA